MRLPHQCLAPDKVRPLVHLDRVRKPCFERRFVGTELGTPGPPTGFDAQRIDRVIPGIAQGEGGPGLVQGVVQRRALVGGHVELITRAADIADARSANPCVADIDFARLGERKSVAGQVVGRQAAEQLGRLRAHHRDDRICRSDVDQRREFVAADVSADPVGVARGLRGAGQDEERVGGGAGQGQIAFEPAALVQHRRVHHPAYRHVDLVGAKTLQDSCGVAAFQDEFGERGLIEYHDVLARGALLVQHHRQPRRRVEGIGNRSGLRAAENSWRAPS